MKERPIIFSAPMVSAILDGLKTQTRRIAKYPTYPGSTPFPSHWIITTNEMREASQAGRHGYVARYVAMRNPDVGKILSAAAWSPWSIGDRLWVRERFRYYYDENNLWDCVQYADGSMIKPDGLDESGGHRFSERCRADSPWRPSIHMPRWASRIALEITDISVERLQDISVDDCIAEGMDPHPNQYIGPYHAYKCLWETINGPGSWDRNDWVWVVSFRKLDT